MSQKSRFALPGFHWFNFSSIALLPSLNLKTPAELTLLPLHLCWFQCRSSFKIAKFTFCGLSQSLGWLKRLSRKRALGVRNIRCNGVLEMKKYPYELSVRQLIRQNKAFIREKVSFRRKWLSRQFAIGHPKFHRQKLGHGFIMYSYNDNIVLYTEIENIF